ncbi:DUF551 domain-containing protein [Cupriavidus sp. UBA2534]|uniref:DUF551 domain-containing protein n=1 Tax=Cupriavidus sp. UBA2534 TaxID=1946399 RepID=UPI000E91E337|nr:DUF551 domain-containing protein [Cupriavidus sp. UBA2534]HBO82074.1 hypothetical protein [Cupriavidus sp.]
MTDTTTRQPGSLTDEQIMQAGMIHFRRAQTPEAALSYIAAVRECLALATPAPTVPEGILDALRFYANGSHFNIADDTAWDTVSGEPQNFLCDEAGTATVEDGSIAKLALQGKFFTDQEYQEPSVQGEVFTAAKTPAAKPDWISVAQIMPHPGQQVLATYINRASKPRTIRARYVADKTVEANIDADDSCTEYDEATDTYYLQGGWYEQIDNWGDYSSVQVCEGDITHWMPMPDSPSMRDPSGAGAA